MPHAGLEPHCLEPVHTPVSSCASSLCASCGSACQGEEDVAPSKDESAPRRPASSRGSGKGGACFPHKARPAPRASTHRPDITTACACLACLSSAAHARWTRVALLVGRVWWRRQGQGQGQGRRRVQGPRARQGPRGRRAVGRAWWFGALRATRSGREAPPLLRGCLGQRRGGEPAGG